MPGSIVCVVLSATSRSISSGVPRSSATSAPPAGPRISAISKVWSRIFRWGDLMGRLLTRLIALVLALGVEAAAYDWPQFLGPDRNGVYRGPALSEKWGPN